MQVLYNGDISVTRTRLPFFHKGLSKKMEKKSEDRKLFLENIKAEKKRFAEETENNPEPPDFIPKYKRVYNKAKRFVKKHVLKEETTQTKKQYTQLRNLHSKFKRLHDYQQELVFENRVPKNIHARDKSLFNHRAAPVNSEQDKHIFKLQKTPVKHDDVTDPEPNIERVDSNRTPATILLNSRSRTPVATKQTVDHPSTTEKNEFQISPPLQNVSAEPANIPVTSVSATHVSPIGRIDFSVNETTEKMQKKWKKQKKPKKRPKVLKGDRIRRYSLKRERSAEDRNDVQRAKQIRMFHNFPSPAELPAEFPAEPFMLESKHGSRKKGNQAVESHAPLQEPAIRALDKPMEATGNPPGKKKPKKFAKSAERLEYKEYSPKVKGVIKADLARTRIPHKRILEFSSDLKQTRFSTYEQKAEYLIDNYNNKLDAQFTFTSKNVYVCGNIVIKFAPNTKDELPQYELLEYEIYILSQLKDKTKHIVNILHHGKYNNHLYLITSYLTKYVPLNEITDFHFDYRSVYHQVQEVLRVMHGHGYAHYNMILNNIMFNPSTKQICIVDFSRTCVNDVCFHTDTLDSKSPSYPPYYGQILAANQPKHTDYYFMAVVLVFLISKGTVSPINKKRTEYMNAVKTFVRTLTDQHEQTQIKTLFVLSAIDDNGRFSYEKIFSAHTPKSTPRQQLDAKYLIDTKFFNETRDYEQKDTIQKVGEGTYGCVFRIGLEFIIKIPSNDGIQSLRHEINIFEGIRNLKHPNIVTYVYSDTYRNIPYLILTYLKDYMTLYATVKSHADYNTQDIYDQIMSAVNAIHNAGYAHYDLSLGNIMYNHTTGHVCIIDFGVACHIDCEGFEDFDLNENPAFPPHHGNGKMSTEQGKTSDKYFIAIAVVYMLSNGQINHYDRSTRTVYMTRVKAFLEKPKFKKWYEPVMDLLMASFNYIDPL